MNLKEVKCFFAIASVLFSIGYLRADVITVTNLDNDGIGSLRDAMQTASSGDSIVFNSDLSGSISLQSVLPIILVSDLNINGNLDDNGIPMVAIDGSGIGGDSWGFRITGASTTNCGVSNLSVVGCNRGIYISDAANSATVSHCFIGTVDGINAFPNYYGISIINCSGVTIDSNTISGNDADGIQATVCSNCMISDNYIGLDASGSMAIGNGGCGIDIIARGGHCDLNTITKNVISANQAEGIWLNVDQIASNAYISNTRIEGNLVGTDCRGSALAGLGNGGNGLSCEGDWFDADATNGMITNSVIVGNVISGNALNGIYFGDNVVGNSITNNKIGVALDGVTGLPNTMSGIILDNVMAASSGNMLGGLGINDGNIIAYNGNYGISAPSGVNISNSFLTNSIYSNISTPAISLTAGENNNQQPPAINSAVYDSNTSSINVSGIAPVVGSGDSVPLFLQFFVTSSSMSASNPQGEIYIGSFEASAGESFNETFIFTNPAVGNYFLTATATALNNSGGPGDTSQFSDPVALSVSSFSDPYNVPFIASSKFTLRLIQKYEPIC